MNRFGGIHPPFLLFPHSPQILTFIPNHSNMKRITLILLVISFTLPEISQGQQYKIRQSTSMAGMTSETTIYVKGTRRRTESPGIMGIGASTTIEQCDLQRTVKLNDKKKLYFLEPFAKEEVINEDVKPTVKTKPVTPAKTTTEKGGVIHMYYNITDTGERKKINGFTARHIWTTQKLKPDANACMMKDSMIIKTDGWYIDLPQFTCPIRYTLSQASGTQEKPECQDRFVTHYSGKGKLGFPLTETKTMIMNGQKSDFTTSMETVELSTQKLDSMLFEIPPGYKQTMNQDELQDGMTPQEMMNKYKDYEKNKGNSNPSNGNNSAVPGQKRQGVARVGVLTPTGDGIQTSELQQSIAGSLNNSTTESITLNSEADASASQCDYVIMTQITKIKQASKVGGFIKAIKNADPSATSYNIEATMTVKNVADGSVKTQQNISGKYEGKTDDAVRKAMEEGVKMVLKNLK